MKNIIFTIVLLCGAGMAQADALKFSYLYIQGDKQTPFYVKLEDAMQPRFGKNYCIVPKLAPGPAHVEILFQQNIFPPQHFNILIPEGGSRGFMLVRAESGGFLLYDLQQGFYLASGNKVEADRMPEVINHGATAAQNAVQADAVPVLSEPANDGKPVFISDLEFSRGQRADSGQSSVTVAPTGSVVTQAITNTDCPTPIGTSEFGKIFNTLSAMPADEERLEYFFGQLDKCYETWQARTLASKFSADAARYELLRKIYPRITDQAAFPLLDDLLTTDIWKAEFNRLVHH